MELCRVDDREADGRLCLGQLLHALHGVLTGDLVESHRPVVVFLFGKHVDLVVLGFSGCADSDITFFALPVVECSAII